MASGTGNPTTHPPSAAGPNARGLSAPALNAPVWRAALAALVLATSGCYVSTKLPLDQNLDRTELGDKVGRSSAQGLLWTVAWGDAGIQAAARNGGIRTIQHADQEFFVILGGLYARRTTIVYGD